MVVKKQHEVAEKLMVVFYMINWCVPALLLGAAWYEDHLGYTENKSTVDWCWIKVHSGDHRAETVWMLVCGKLWEIISYFINGALYFSVTRNIKRELSARHHLMSSQSVEIAQQGGKKLALVPVIFVALRIWGTIRFLIFAFSADIPNILNEILTTLQIIGDNSQGIANFILFCLLTEKFKRNICKVCRYGQRSSAYTSLISERQKSQHGRTFSDSTKFRP